MNRLMVCFVLLLLTTRAWAQECVVNDPTGTPLNVRARPDGAIVGALYNGVTVYVRDSWAYVVSLKAGKAGWVFRECIDRG